MPSFGKHGVTAPIAAFSSRRTEFLIAAASSLSALAFLSPIWGGLILCVIAVSFAVSQPKLLFFSMAALLPLPMYLLTDSPFRDIGSATRIILFLVLIQREYSRGPVFLKRWLWGGKITKLFLAYVFVCLASDLLNPATYYTSRALLRLISYLAFYYAAKATVRTESDVRITIRILMTSTIIICLVGYWQLAIDDFGTFWHFLYDEGAVYYAWVRRTPSVFARDNLFAGYLNWMIATGLGFAFFKGDKTLRVLSFLAVAMGLVALILTQSRGALGGLGAIVLLSLVLLPLSARGRVIGVAFLAGVALAVYISPQALPDRFATIDAEALGRLAVFAYAIELFQKSPVIGIGYGSFRYYSANILPDALDTHNLYLKLLAETGIVGAIGYLSLKASVVWQALSARRTSSSILCALAFAVIAGTAAELVHGTVDVFLEVAQVSCVGWMLIAMLASVCETQKDEIS